MTDTLVAPTFLFRFAIPCRYRKTIWSSRGARLGPEFAIPELTNLDGKRPFAQLRAAWNEKGLVFELRVSGRRQSVWCDRTSVFDSDGLSLWIDTRDSHQVHRATRYCHHFVFLPTGAGPNLDQPFKEKLLINRAREQSHFVAPKTLGARTAIQRGGYRLTVHIPADALTGFDPDEQPRLGFFYAVRDRELGYQSLCLGREFPVNEDPSLWGSLILQSGGTRIA